MTSSRTSSVSSERPSQGSTREAVFSPDLQHLTDLLEADGQAGSYAISTMVNLPQGRSQLSNLSSSLGSSFPQSLKPSTLASLASSAPTSLAPPHKRSTPPPLQLSEPARMQQDDVERYLAEISAEWSRWQRNVGTASTDLVASALEHPQFDMSADDVEPDWMVAGPPPLSQTSALPSLSEVPIVFFRDDFSLADASTFDTVTDRAPPISAHFAYKSAFAEPANGIGHTRNLQPLSIPDLATDQIVQEKLSHYLDIIELHLVAEISQRSTPFFSALGNLQALHAETAACLAQVQVLEKELHDMDEAVAKRGLELIRLDTRRRSLTRIESSLFYTQGISAVVSEAEQLTHAGDWVAALDVIDGVEGFWPGNRWHLPRLTSDLPAQPKLGSWHETGKPNLEIPRLRSLEGMPSRLRGLRNAIGVSLGQELVSMLTQDSRNWTSCFAASRDPDGHQSDDKGRTGGTIDDTTCKAITDHLKSQVRPLIEGLARTDWLEHSVKAWREAVQQEIRVAVQQELPMYLGAAFGTENHVEEADSSAITASPPLEGAVYRSLCSKEATLPDIVHALSCADFLRVSQQTFRRLNTLICVVEIHAKVFAEEAQRALKFVKEDSPGELQTSMNRPGLSPSTDSNAPYGNGTKTLTEEFSSSAIDVDLLAQDLADIAPGAAELANVQFSKVLAMRSDAHEEISLPDFVDLFDLTWSFVVACEVTSRRMIPGVRGVIMAQAKAFLQSFHQKNITEGAKVVEQEQWIQTEVSPRLQLTVKAIIASAVEDPPELAASNSSMPAALPGVPDSQPARQVDIEGSLFHAVPAVLRTLVTLAEYLRLAINCSLLATDAMSKVVEFLKAFNSRTCQVVLGAGAMRSAGLKNITAKHLALASQTLSIMINLIPYIRECLRRHMNQKQAVMLVDFDKLKRDFQEHQNEIHSKLVSIMGDRLAVHVKSLQGIDWGGVRGVDANVPSAYAEGLLKEVSTLHKVLSRYLQTSTVEVIMMQVFSTINSRLADEFTQITLPSEAAKKRLRTDARFVKTKLQELQGFERSPQGSDLEVLAEAKILPNNAEARETQRASDEKSRQPAPPAEDASSQIRNSLEGLREGAASEQIVQSGSSRPPGAAVPPTAQSMPEPSTESGAPTETLTTECQLREHPDNMLQPHSAASKFLFACSQRREEAAATARQLPPVATHPDESRKTLSPSPDPGHLAISTGLPQVESTGEHPETLSQSRDADGDGAARPEEHIEVSAKPTLTQRLAALAGAGRDATGTWQSPVLPLILSSKEADRQSSEPNGSLRDSASFGAQASSLTPGRQALRDRLAAVAGRGHATPALTSAASEEPVKSTDTEILTALASTSLPAARASVDVAPTNAAGDATVSGLTQAPAVRSPEPPPHPAEGESLAELDRLRSPTLSQRSVPSSPGPSVVPIAHIPLPASPTLTETNYAVYKRKGPPRSGPEARIASLPSTPTISTSEM